MVTANPPRLAVSMFTKAPGHSDTAKGQMMTETITTHSSKLTDEQAAYIDDLERLTAFLVRNPQFIPTYGGINVSLWCYSNVGADYPQAVGEDGEPLRTSWGEPKYDYSKEPINREAMNADIKAQMADYARALKPCDKDYSNSIFTLTKRFGRHHIDVQGHRDAICKRIVTGTHTEQRTDPNAPKVDIEVEDVDWICDSSILGDA